jgi:hypothetical protein
MSDNTALWGVYTQSDDETHDGWHAAPSRASADAMAATLAGHLKPVVAPWPFGAEEHAADLARKGAA